MGSRRKRPAAFEGRRLAPRAVLEDAPSIPQGEHQHHVRNRKVGQSRAVHRHAGRGAAAASQDESHLTAGKRDGADAVDIEEPGGHHAEERGNVGLARAVVDDR